MALSSMAVLSAVRWCQPSKLRAGTARSFSPRGRCADKAARSPIRCTLALDGPQARMSNRGTTLADEVRYLHQSLFTKREPLDEKIVQRYEAAHGVLFPGERRETVARIVERRLDVEAVEFALRRRRLCPE